MRRANDRPTTIYWLIDVRPETQQATRSAGFPFYCGKTVDTLPRRIAAHRDSANKHPNRRISQWLKACGRHVRVQVVDTVPVGDDWSAVEKRWIEVIRFSFPGGANANSGGQGAPGLVHSTEARAKISAAHKGKTVSKATRVKISASHRGKKHTLESCSKRGDKMRGGKRPNYKRQSRSERASAHRMDKLADRFLAERRAKNIARKQERTSITS